MPTFACRIPAIAWLALVLAPAACSVDISYDGTEYRCPDGECPSGYECQAGRCVREGTVADASPPPDAPRSIDATPPPPDAAPAIDPTLGNVLYYSFDGDYDPAEVIRDRGPWGLSAEVANGPNITAGRHGSGRDFDDPDGEFLRIPDSEHLFVGNQITIEAWISPEQHQDQAIFSDFDFDDAPQTEYSFELTNEGGLAFYSNDGCEVAHQVVATDEVSLPLNQFTHVAVTWDGAEVRFYVDAALVQTVPFPYTPCAHDRREWRVGRREGGAFGFEGTIDELKVSDYPKSAAALAASRDFDPTAVDSVCGDRIVEGDEACDGEAACCDVAQCRFEADGSACPDGSCQDGLCAQPGGRVVDGLVALYEFDDGDGITVADTSGFGPSLDLLLENRDDRDLPPEVTWGQGSLTLDDDSAAESTVAADKITDTCRDSGEITVEAWVSSDNEFQDGPARIVTVSEGPNDRNFTLGQDRGTYVLRLTTTHSGSNGEPPVIATAEDVRAGVLTHVVGVRHQDALQRIYVDGLLRGESRLEGDLSNWDDSWRFALGNEFNASRTWLGTYHLVAIYCRALASHEVARNFLAGANP